MTRPFPAEDGAFTLAIAHSVFTHLVESQVEHYLREVTRILRPDGVLLSTWFFFEKDDFPMMQEWTNALYINLVDPSAAVILDKTWVRETARKAGLTLVAAEAPEIRGFQWTCTFAPAGSGREEVELPQDTAPVGLVRVETAPAHPHTVGL
jgi:SAM-dependent methyltransferase